uniref:Uncharacterized protein n=1 Tax=Arundo donax TaxID=35708 RepID=A0A0A8Z7Z6_ARUDO
MSLTIASDYQKSSPRQLGPVAHPYASPH